MSLPVTPRIRVPRSRVAGLLAALASGCAASVGAHTPDAAADDAPLVDTISDAALAHGPVVGLAGNGAGHCALRQSGEVLCWGWGHLGQRGNGTLVTSATPLPVANLDDADALVAGHTDACAHERGGGWMCWGFNNYSQLGDGTATMRVVPVPLRTPLAELVQLSVGGIHACGVGRDGAAYCWGYNGSGALGDGTTTDQAVPVRVTGLTNVMVIRAGRMYGPEMAEVAGPHSCALRQDGTVACWGSNRYGQVGDGTTTTRLTPTPVAGLRDVVEIALGLWHTCARRRDGTVVCWGLNAAGQLGDGSTTDRTQPVAVVGLTDAVAISLGFHFGCALRATGMAVCWGDGSFGQSGDGSFTWIHSTPVTVAALPGLVEVSAAGDSVCARNALGSVFCWGANNRSDLGDPGFTVRMRATPGLVVGL